jgi:hypothetical protein
VTSKMTIRFTNGTTRRESKTTSTYSMKDWDNTISLLTLTSSPEQRIVVCCDRSTVYKIKYRLFLNSGFQSSMLRKRFVFGRGEIMRIR